MGYKGRRVLVTGADGFIGSHLTEALVAAGAEVTALSLYNSFGGNGWLDSLDAEVLASLKIQRGDVRDPGFVRRLIDGQETVFHLAALIAIPFSYTAAQSYIDTNVSGTLNILEAANNAGVARVVHTSTSEVYGTAQFTPMSETHPLHGQSPYSASKIGADMMAEAYARSFSLPVAILRPFNTYGPRQSERAVIPSVIRQALDPNCAEIRVGDLSPKRDFTFVKDTAKAFVAAGTGKLEHGTPYNCGTGGAVAIAELVDRIVALTGCNKPVRSETARRRPDKSEVFELCADPSRFGAATGWRASVSFDDGLTETIDWWRARITSGSVRRSSNYLT